MVISKKLAGALAVATVLAFAPAAGATEAPPGPGTGSPTQPSPSCSSYWRAAKTASDIYWFSNHGGPPLSADDYNDLRDAYLSAVADYESRFCRLFMGAPPQWGAYP